MDTSEVDFVQPGLTSDPPVRSGTWSLKGTNLKGTKKMGFFTRELEDLFPGFLGRKK